MTPKISRKRLKLKRVKNAIQKAAEQLAAEQARHEDRQVEICHELGRTFGLDLRESENMYMEIESYCFSDEPKPWEKEIRQFVRRVHPNGETLPGVLPANFSARR
jgi:hypothetical protein